MGTLDPEGKGSIGITAKLSGITANRQCMYINQLCTAVPNHKSTFHSYFKHTLIAHQRGYSPLFEDLENVVEFGPRCGIRVPTPDHEEVHLSWALVRTRQHRMRDDGLVCLQSHKKEGML